MILLITILLAAHHSVALPFGSLGSLRAVDFNGTASHQPTPPALPGEDGSRTVLSISWSCLSTIAACIYGSTHPNIPEHNASWWGAIQSKLVVAFYTLLAPELVIWWAMRQYLGARAIAKSLEWTSTRGHFAQMGGFSCRKTKYVLPSSHLRNLLESDQLSISSLRITQKEIEDRSKGDFLSKGLVALQTGWFIIGCVTRWVKGWRIAELEVVTLAFAALNGVMYTFWWNKPLDVGCPIYVELKEKPEANDSHDITATGPLGTSATLPVATNQPGSGVSLATSATLARSDEPQKAKSGSATPFYIVSNPFIAFVRQFHRLLNQDSTHPHSTSVGMFYAHPLSRATGETGTSLDDGSASISFCSYDLVWFTSCVMGIIFGGIHLLSWSSDTFPRPDIERPLWRACTIVVAFIPTSLLFTGVLGKIYYSVPATTPISGLHMTPWLKAREGARKLIGLVMLLNFGVTLYLGTVMYTLARIDLVAQAFVALRDIPADSELLKSVDWTEMILHL